MSRSASLVVVALALAACARKPAESAVAKGDARADFRPSAWESFSPEIEAPRRALVQDLLCSATPKTECEDECLALSGRDAAECALELAYADDEEARTYARELVVLTGAVPGLEKAHDIDAAYLGRIAIEPVLPIGPYRQHLVWVRDALVEIERVFAAVVRSAPRDVMFRTRPHGFRFFKTAERTYPSAYAIDGVVGYNVEGPYHDSPERVTTTLFHELFHLNDEGHGNWSNVALVDPFQRVVAKCADDDACLSPFAPTEDRVPGGTFYPFDSRTRDVREYAAELALRWFTEQRAVLAGEVPQSPFKCATPINALAWGALVDEFFGGLDLTPACAT